MVYLFVLVYIESELVKFNIRKEQLKNQLQELKNEKVNLLAKIAPLTNPAHIEAEAKKHGFIFPDRGDILGTVK
ncbi:MAG: septum formation initiator family protein [candidate division WOR-3 bacterium]